MLEMAGFFTPIGGGTGLVRRETAPYEKTRYRKFFAELILNEYDGRCLSTDEEMKAQPAITAITSPMEEGVKT
jgi:hypothetical protein